MINVANRVHVDSEKLIAVETLFVAQHVSVAAAPPIFGLGQGFRASSAAVTGLRVSPQAAIFACACAIRGRIGHRARACLACGFALAFVVHVEKGLVLYDRAAEGTAKLVIVKWVLGPHIVEIVARP